jgi:hypothetical protein
MTYPQSSLTFARFSSTFLLNFFNFFDLSSEFLQFSGENQQKNSDKIFTCSSEFSGSQNPRKPPELLSTFPPSQLPLVAKALSTLKGNLVIFIISLCFFYETFVKSNLFVVFLCLFHVFITQVEATKPKSKGRQQFCAMIFLRRFPATDANRVNISDQQVFYSSIIDFQIASEGVDVDSESIESENIDEIDSPDG